MCGTYSFVKILCFNHKAEKEFGTHFLLFFAFFEIENDIMIRN